MLTRYYKKDQVWTKETELTLQYVEIDSSEFEEGGELVPSVNCILPEGHPKKCIGCNCTAEPVEQVVPEVLPEVEHVAPVKKKARRKPAKK